MPEQRLIDANALKDSLYAMYRTQEQIPSIEIDEHLILLTIENASTVESKKKKKKKKGKWHPIKDNAYYAGECSECGCIPMRTVFHEPYNFCPKCGADMRKEPEP